MAKKQRSRKEQLAEVIRESHEQWKRLWENGGSDPFEKGRIREKDLDFDAFMYKPSKGGE